MNARELLAKTRFAVLALAVGASSGCRVGPDYAAPAPGTPGSFENTGSEGFANTSRVSAERPAESAWWVTLGDPTLDSLIDRAVASNLDLRIAEARIREARAQRGVVSTDALPALSINGSATRQRTSGATKQGQFITGSRVGNLFDGEFDASWELDIWGGNARAVEAADAEIGSSVEARRDVLVTLLGEVARTYVELRGFQGRLEIANRNIELQRQTLGLSRSRFDAGLTSEVDVAQADAVLAQTQSIVPSLDAGARGSIHRLSVLLGRPPGSLSEELARPSPIPRAPAEIPVGVPSDLLRRRPDIRRAERDVAAATARIGVATANLFPQFSLTGSFGHQSRTLSEWSEPSARFWSFGPAVRWPVFQWGRVRAGIRVEDARTEVALAIYERTVLTALEDVENAMVGFTREQGRRAALQSAVDSNRRAFDLSEQLYRNGLTDFQRVIDSQRSLQLSEDQLVDSERTVATNLVALYKALGGGWGEIEDRQTRVGTVADDRPESGDESPSGSGDSDDGENRTGDGAGGGGD